MSEEQMKDPRIRKLLNKSTDHVVTKNNTIFSRTGIIDRWLIVPEHMTEKLTIETHETIGHPGRFKTYHAMRETCTFKNMHRTVAKVIKNCDKCQRNKPINFSPHGITTSHKPKKLLEKISIDLMGPLPTGRGGTHYILAILDIFSKYNK